MEKNVSDVRPAVFMPVLAPTCSGAFRLLTNALTMHEAESCCCGLQWAGRLETDLFLEIVRLFLIHLSARVKIDVLS